MYTNVQAPISLDGVEKETLEAMHNIVVASMSNNVLIEPFRYNTATLFQMGSSSRLLANVNNDRIKLQFYQMPIDHRGL